MKVKFTRNTVANRQVCRVGDIVDLPADEARKVLLAGKGIAYVEEAKADADAAEAKETQGKGKGRGRGRRAEANPEPVKEQEAEAEEVADGDEPQDPFADASENKEQ